MNKQGIHTLLTKYTSVKVHADFIPEKAKLPAIVFNHISNIRNRILSGKTNGITDTWRISIVCRTNEESDRITKEVENLDNSSSQDFKNVLVITTNNEPVDPKTKLIRTFIDLKTIER